LIESRDEKLMMLIQQGDHRACQELVERHLPPLHRYAVRLLGNITEAEDAVQDTFIKVWQNARQWQPGKARVTTWLHTIAHNVCIDKLRKARHFSEVDMTELSSVTPGPQETMTLSSEAAIVFNSLGLLPEKQRSAIVLCHYQGFSNRDAAEILDCSVDALESLLARARRKLKQTLVETDEEQSRAR
jgi:RNA polymerase sigma-70 factor (ECF subfamily)